MKPKSYMAMLKETAQEFMKDKAPRLAAALAYYTLFALAPLLIIAIAIAGMVFGAEAARGQIMQQLSHILGPEGAKGVQDMLVHSSQSKSGVVATVIGGVTLLLGASGVFGQLKDALNTIWNVPPKENSGILGMLRERFLSISMVMGVGFLLLVSLVVSAGVAAVGKVALGSGSEVLLQLVTFLLDIAVASVLFALLFRYLPDQRVAWKNVWVGAGFTSVLFAVGKIAIGIYLGKSAIASSFGAAASLAILLVWLYYSGLIFFFGAEFTEVHSRATSPTPRTEERPREHISEAAREAIHKELGMDRPRPAIRPLEKPQAARNSSKTAIAGAGAAGVVAGALGVTVGAMVVALKGAKRLFRI